MGGGVRLRGGRSWARRLGSRSVPVLLALSRGGPVLLRTDGYRTNIVRLRVYPEDLKELVYTALRYDECIEFLNELRRELYEAGLLDSRGFAWTRQEAHLAFGEYLKGNVHLVARLNEYAWRGFMALKKLEEEGRLPRGIRVRMPGRGRRFGRCLRLFVDSSYYRVLSRVVAEEMGMEVGENCSGVIVLNAPVKMAVGYHGVIRWSGAQSYMVVKIKDPSRVYAYIHVRVLEPSELEVAIYKGRRVVFGERYGLRSYDPLGSFRAWVDLGVRNLIAAVVEDGTALLYRTGILRSMYNYYRRRKRELMRLIEWLSRTTPNSPWIERYEEELEDLRERTFRKLRLVRRRAVRHFVNECWKLGVSRIYVGYPSWMNMDHPLSSIIMAYSETAWDIARVGEEYGIRVYAVDERGSSRRCSLCDEAHANGRIHTGLWRCPKTGLEINADLNSARNLAGRVSGVKPPLNGRLLSFIVTLEGVWPANQRRGPKPGNPPSHSPDEG